MFGGNSNWRGPIWFPVNVLLADKLRTYGRHFGDSFTVEIPTGSGQRQDAGAGGRRHRPRADGAVPAGARAGARPTASGSRRRTTRCGREHPTFSEYFDGDTGEGLGATHQTGRRPDVGEQVAELAAGGQHLALDVHLVVGEQRR